MQPTTVSASIEADYQRDGYILLSDVVTEEGVAVLVEAGTRALAVDRPQRILDPTSGHIRVLFDIHNLDPLFGELVNEALFVDLATRLLGGEAYVLQTQLNPKSPFDEVSWDWHTDFGFWHTRDGMRSPQVLTVMLFLEDSTTENGPVVVVPGSHLEDLPGHTVPLELYEPGNKDERYHLSEEVVAELVERRGMEVLTAGAGSLIVFDGRVVHSSQANTSPRGRMAVIIRYNRLANTLPEIGNPRVEWKVTRSPRPLEPRAMRFVQTT